MQRTEIIVTVDWGKLTLGSPTSAMNHWEATLRKFMLEGRPPHRADWVMDRYEERVRKVTGKN